MNAVITVDTDGNIECLWTEDLPLEALGALHVRRASNIEFNDARQKWEVILATSPDVVAFSHPSRAACIEWEIETINNQLLTNENYNINRTGSMPSRTARTELRRSLSAHTANTRL